MCPNISIVVHACNPPKHLELCLGALFVQTDTDFEVLVCGDVINADGYENLRSAIHQVPWNRLAWLQGVAPDFHGPFLLNCAVLDRVEGDYVVLIEDDVLVPPNFIASFRKGARTGALLAGPVAQLPEAECRRVLDHYTFFNHPAVPAIDWTDVARVIELLLPGFEAVGELKVVVEEPPAVEQAFGWKPWAALGDVALGVWVSDFKAVKGLDEVFLTRGGWQTDLALRLYHHGVAVDLGRRGTASVRLPCGSGLCDGPTRGEAALLEARIRQRTEFAEAGRSVHFSPL